MNLFEKLQSFFLLSEVVNEEAEAPLTPFKRGRLSCDNGLMEAQNPYTWMDGEFKNEEEEWSKGWYSRNGEYRQNILHDTPLPPLK